MSSVEVNNHTNPFYPYVTKPPLQFSDADKSEIAQKINEMIGNSENRLIFFEYQPKGQIFSLSLYGSDRITTFTLKEAKSKETEKKIKSFFNKFFKPFIQFVNPNDITVIDGVSHKVKTTAEPVEKNRIIHPKVPHETECLVGRLTQSAFVSDFVRELMAEFRYEEPSDMPNRNFS